MVEIAVILRRRTFFIRRNPLRIANMIRVSPADGGFIVSWTESRTCDDTDEDRVVSKEAVRTTIEETLKLLGSIMKSKVGKR